MIDIDRLRTCLDDAQAAEPWLRSLCVANLPAAQKTSAKPQAKVSDSGKTYVVAKGDSPVTIARKFKVSYDDLLALNHIDDPRKLKIGQKLLIPEKTSKRNQ